LGSASRVAAFEVVLMSAAAHLRIRGISATVRRLILLRTVRTFAARLRGERGEALQLWHSGYRGGSPTVINNRWIFVVGPIHPQGNVEVACSGWQPVRYLVFAGRVVLEIKIY
ncbi:MAG TPA: hypothetical protein VLX90_16175, partial [Steroidobacteraceae bacterium]|nr:hypothetical protein [Steroidobacteraceae bacterium]